MPSIVGPVGRGNMQYAQMYKAAQRMTDKPVKFGTVTPELVAFAVQDFHYKDVRERIWATQQRVQRGAPRARRRGLPGDPDGRAADPPARGARRRRQGDQPRVHARGVQQHRARTPREDGSLVPHMLGQPVAAAHVRRGAELQAGAEALEQSRRGRDHVRVVQLGRHGSRGDRPRDHRHEDRDRRDRSPLAAGRVAEDGRRPHPHGAQAHSARAARALVRLRHGPRGHGAPPRALQDGVARAGHEHHSQGARDQGSRVHRGGLERSRCST